MMLPAKPPGPFMLSLFLLPTQEMNELLFGISLVWADVKPYQFGFELLARAFEFEPEPEPGLSRCVSRIFGKGL